MPEFKGKFTDLYLKSLKVEVNKTPPLKEYDLRERHGFGIRVRKTGVITFFYMYHFEGKRKFLNLGIYGPPPDASLSDARQKHAAAFAQVKAGIDPMAPPPPPPTKPEEKTVADVTSEFLKKWSQVNYSDRWHYNVEKALKNDVLPHIGDRVITTIRRREIISLLETVVARAPGQARNVYKAVAKMFWYAQDREYIDTTPCIGLLDSIPALRVAEGEKRALDDREIRKAWKRIDRGPGDDSVKRALKLILATAQRPDEVAGMHCDEIKGHWWTIPWQRIKTENSKTKKGRRQDHRVYLSPLALSLIGDRKGFICASADEESPIRRNSLSQRVERGITIERRGKKIQFKYYSLPEWSPNDLRRTARTGMARIEVNDKWIEEVLNHKKDKIRSIYDQHTYDEQKRKALTLWGKHLESIIGGNCLDNEEKL